MKDISCNVDPLGSAEWWEKYFAPGGGWEKNGGRQQTRLFAEAFCKSVQLPFANNFTMLDVGCALGDGVKVLRKFYPHAQLTGLDFSKTAISRCSADLAHISSFMVGDIENVIGDYDVIYISNVLEHFVDYEDKARQLLQKCELLCIMVPFNERYGGENLHPNTERHHQATFCETSFDFLIEERLAARIQVYIMSCPGAWGWTTRQRIVQGCRKIISLFFNREVLSEPLQIVYVVDRKNTK